MSDVWRDIECDPCHGSPEAVDRLCDLFGLSPYKDLQIVDLRQYPIDYFENYFVSWGEVCAAARHEGMTDSPQNVSARELQPNLL